MLKKHPDQAVTINAKALWCVTRAKSACQAQKYKKACDCDQFEKLDQKVIN